jgi:hypothetical protein
MFKHTFFVFEEIPCYYGDIIQDRAGLRGS